MTLWKAGLLAAACVITLAAVPAAAQQIEAIGAEKCADGAKAHEVTFLAPETAALEARAKVLADGATLTRADAATLSLDGKPCTGARCAFQAKKGESYRFAATTSAERVTRLCVSVARP